MVDTGLNSMTGGRLLRLQKFLDDAPFYFTYGDGLANVDLAGVYSRFHESNRTVVVYSCQSNSKIWWP